MDVAPVGPPGMSVLRKLHRVIARISGRLDLPSTLEAVVEGVVDGLGFQVAALNLVMDDGDLEVVAVAGSAQARDALAGRRGSRAEWDRLLASGRRFGVLYLVDGRVDPRAGDLALPFWVPDVRDIGPPPDQPPSDERRWHPLDMVLAPLESATRGLLGVLSVDLPTDGLWPGPEQLGMLEVLAGQAAIAVENARLHEEALRREAERTALVSRLEALVQAAPVPIIELDMEGRVRLWNPEAERVFGWREEEVLGRPTPIVRASWAQYTERQRRFMVGHGVLRSESVRWRRDGSAVWVEQSSAILRDGEGRPIGLIGVLVDVTQRRQLEEQLRHAAQHDALTGLANRAQFDERLHQAMSRSARRGSRVGLLMLDLDDFKTVNDRFGHLAGDAVLRDVADRLRSCTRPEDTVARIGGDEFVVLLEDQEDDVSRVADRIAASVHIPVDSTEVTASVGFAVAHGAVTPDHLLRAADASMYAAKRNRHAVVRAGAEAPGPESGRG